MTKRNSVFTIAGIFIFLLLCLVPTGEAQTCVPASDPGSPAWQLGLKCNLTSVSTPYQFSVGSLTYWQITWVPSGTVSAASLSLDSSATGAAGDYSTGGIITSGTIGSLASAGSYTSSTPTTPTNFGQITPSVTGSGTVTLFLFGYRSNSSASSGPTVTQGTTPWVDNISQIGGTAISLYGLLLNGVAATGTATSGAVRLPGFSATGSLWIGGSSITGSPSGCQVALDLQGSNGGPLSSAIATVAFTPGNSYQSFSVAPSLAYAYGDNLVAVFTCGTYPTAGTISVGFDSLPATSILTSNFTTFNGNAWPSAGVSSGIPKVGIVGNGGNNIDTAPGAALPGHGIETVTQSQSTGSLPAATTNAKANNFLSDLVGNLFVRTGSSQPFSAFITLSTNTTTQIEATPGAGLTLYVTNVVFNTRTAGSATTLQLVQGTGTNCATGQTTLTPTFPDTAVSVSQLNLNSPLVPVAANAICATQAGTTAGTADVLITGFVAP
ncbi:MAG TPA: hypothetical protein VGM18_04910 [Candidatus Sulfotelmatobacter sp.]|jgi:hypothetical protein